MGSGPEKGTYLLRALDSPDCLQARLWFWIMSKESADPISIVLTVLWGIVSASGGPASMRGRTDLTRLSGRLRASRSNVLYSCTPSSMT